jgi:hypothetical protein
MEVCTHASRERSVANSLSEEEMWTRKLRRRFKILLIYGSLLKCRSPHGSMTLARLCCFFAKVRLRATARVGGERARRRAAVS